MTIQEYSDKAITTAIYPNQGNNLPYTILGLAEEVLEFIEKYEAGADGTEIKKEGGDVYWYINATCSEIKCSFSDIAEAAMEYESTSINILSVLKYTQYLLGTTKKSIRDNNGVLLEEKRALLETSMIFILQYVNNVCSLFDMNIESILQTNIDKLFSRKERGVLGGSGDNR